MMYPPPAYMSHMPPNQPWPYQYHGCCNNNPYNYYYYAACPYTFQPQPHYSHCPPPFHPHGVYPPLPVPYSVPPQHYSVDQPRNDYDNHHCCGCNHKEVEDERRPMIKEESQVDNKTSDSLLLKDRPVMWIPGGYMSDTESKENERDKYSHEPASLKHLEPPSKQGEVAQDERGNRFPFQIFWLPSNNDQVGKDSKENNNLYLEANKGLPDEKTIKNNEGECEASSKHAAAKVFPVKQAITNEQPGSKHAVQKVIPVKQASANEEKKNPTSIVNSDSGEKTDNGSKASPKTSKLPPVCLRIDPLPKKKKSSRSPSPAEKGRSNGSPVESPKSSEQQSEGNIRTVDQIANKVKRANHGDVPRGKGDETEKGKVEEKKNIPEKVDESGKGKVEKKNLSKHEAALIIQSVYHGFEVRKSQPLKKLRQISEVKQQIFDLRNRIQDLDTSSSIDGKKKVIIGETIMSLLLKLDTIQGLHPFVREVRKSVAKELVGLQEKLDSLTSVKSETTSEGTVGSPQQVMNPEDVAIQGTCDQEQAQTGSCEIHENKDAESHYDDDAEVRKTPNVEKQLEKSTEDDAIHVKFDQVASESDTVTCENHEEQATVSQEGCNTTSEPQLESHIEKIDQAPTECDEALRGCENYVVEATESQEGCNVVGEPQLVSCKEKLDKAPTECDEAQGLCESHEVKGTESQEGEPQLESHMEKSDHTLTECDEALGFCEDHEVEARESHESFNVVGEPQSGSHEEKLDETPTECDEAPGQHDSQEVKATELQEGCNFAGEPQLESHKEKLTQALTGCDEGLGLRKENHEVESIESQEGGNTIGEPQVESHIDQAPTERDEASGLHKENREVEATESEEGHNTVGESHEEKSDQAASEYNSTNEALGLCENHEAEAIDDGGVEAHNMKVEDNTEELNMAQLEMQVESEDLVNVESMMHDSDVCEEGDDKNVVDPGDDGNAQTDNRSMVSEAKDEEAQKANESDGRLMEENEKLRVAVEELMKAGNEQLGVIRELTGRVKDLEKKLSKQKKKKVKVNKCRRSRDCVV